MIDWSALVASALPISAENTPKPGCSHTACGNKGGDGQNVGTLQSIEDKGVSGFVPTVPTVPTTFKEVRVESAGNANPLSFLKPAGGGVEGQSAPHKKACEPSCPTCAHLGRPGLSDGHCGGRDDLPPAYGPGHPLRQLPPDGGANCPAWRIHPYF
jgi:hypothetical protein